MPTLSALTKSVNLLTSIASQVGTPCYVYFRQEIESCWHAFNEALSPISHKIYYAVKANSHIAILNILARMGSGFDIVSVGELERVLKAGGSPEDIVFSGVGKSYPEIKRALEVGVGCFNVESKGELERLQDLASAMNKKAKIAFRINPNVDPKSHPYISTGLKENKFGIAYEEAPALYHFASTLSHIQIIGIACHIGSQIMSVSPFVDALDKMLRLIDQLSEQGLNLEHLNMGGGLGVQYHTEIPPSPEAYAKTLSIPLQNRALSLHLEPGRAIVANAGILLTKVEYIKERFAVVDAGMNDLLRPALYHAWQDIVPLINKPNLPLHNYDVVGPVCESSDFLGKNRPLRIEQGDVLAILGSGAYGFSMSSQYNSRPKAPEVIVDGNTFKVIRPRETIYDLFANESLIK